MEFYQHPSTNIFDDPSTHIKPPNFDAYLWKDAL